MNPEVFAEFLSRQGHRILKTESCYWFNAQPGFYFFFPYHKLITPGKEELKRLLWGGPCIGMRFFTPLEMVGKESYMIECSDKNYDISSIHKKSRSQTHKGLDNFDIRQIDFEELAILGVSLNHDTLVRQGRNPQQWDKHKWQFYCSATEGLPGFEAWGAFSGCNLAAFMMTFQMEDHFTILHHSSATEYLPLYPNNALVFYITQLKLASSQVTTVSYGPQSLDAPESLDKFKFRMGFKKKAMKQSIVFHPVLRPFVNEISYKSIRMVSTLKPESDMWRKLLGIIQFYRESS